MFRIGDRARRAGTGGFWNRAANHFMEWEH